MIKPDGSARHNHTLTDFIVFNVSHPDNNSTIYNWTATISLQGGLATDIPTSKQNQILCNNYKYRSRKCR